MSFEITEKSVRKVYRLYTEAVKEIVALVTGRVSADEVTDDDVFEFSKHPGLRKKVGEILNRLLNRLMKNYNQTFDAQYLASQARASNMVSDMFKGKLTDEFIAARVIGFHQGVRAAEAAKKFLSDSTKRLSANVWKYVKPLAKEMEMVIDLGLLEGKSAAQIARESVQFLKNPNNVFRRVMGKAGLRLSRAAEAFNPGRGVARSSYKNAERLARTTINNAYRSADLQQWANLPMVVGIEIRRSNHVYECDQCDALVGLYPKDFDFSGWHPNCRCPMTPVIYTEAETAELTRRILAGDDRPVQSKREVKKVPKGFIDYVEKIKGKLLKAKNPPYWVQDNFKNGNVSEGLRVGLF